MTQDEESDLKAVQNRIANEVRAGNACIHRYVQAQFPDLSATDGGTFCYDCGARVGDAKRADGRIEMIFGELNPTKVEVVYADPQAKT